MVPEREQLETDSGRIPLSEVLDVFERRDDRARPLTADDIIEVVDCSRRTTHNKLNELVDRDILRTRKWAPEAASGGFRLKPHQTTSPWNHGSKNW